jgi:hypothetical protein
MNQTYSLLRSKTFWTIVLMAVVGAGNAVIPVIPTQYAAVMEVVLAAIASIFHQQTGLSTTGTN